MKCKFLYLVLLHNKYKNKICTKLYAFHKKIGKLYRGQQAKKKALVGKFNLSCHLQNPV